MAFGICKLQAVAAVNAYYSIYSLCSVGKRQRNGGEIVNASMISIEGGCTGVSDRWRDDAIVNMSHHRMTCTPE